MHKEDGKQQIKKKKDTNRSKFSQKHKQESIESSPLKQSSLHKVSREFYAKQEYQEDSIQKKGS